MGLADLTDTFAATRVWPRDVAAPGAVAQENTPPMHLDRSSAPPTTRHSAAAQDRGGARGRAWHEIRCLASARRRLKQRMPRHAHRHLRAVGTLGLTVSGCCRTSGCPLPRQGALGFCAECQAIHEAARTLRRRLLARRIAHLQAARPQLFAALDPALRTLLLEHLAAQGAHRRQHASVVELAGLEDFFAELCELGLAEPESPA